MMSSTHVIMGLAIGGTACAPYAMPTYLTKGSAAVAPTCTRVHMYRALGNAQLLLQHPPLQGPQWHRVLVPHCVGEEVVLGTHPNAATHHRVGVLDDDLEILAQVGDEYIHHLSPEACHVQCHVSLGSGRWNASSTLPHCLGVVGSVTPVVHRPTAFGQ